VDFHSRLPHLIWDDCDEPQLWQGLTLPIFASQSEGSDQWEQMLAIDDLHQTFRSDIWHFFAWPRFCPKFQTFKQKILQFFCIWFLPLGRVCTDANGKGVLKMSLSVISNFSLTFKARELKFFIHNSHINDKKATKGTFEICSGSWEMEVFVD